MKKYQAQLVVGISFEADEDTLETSLNPQKLEEAILTAIGYSDAWGKAILNALTGDPHGKMIVSVTYETVVEE